VLPHSKPLARWAAPAICFYLAGLTWIVFGQTLKFQFVNLDDNFYVYENAHVLKGLSFRGIAWAFLHPVLFLWTPLTTVSHMLDCQLFGAAPAGHHLANALLHMATAILLFLVLRRMTGAQWRSAFAAAVFAIHPLRVESVAWVSERKDVLSGVFFMAALGAYAAYVRSPSAVRYAAVTLFFILGLLVKPMLVTLPGLLLVLDYWPLGRWSARAWVEKAPLFVVSAVCCVVTILVGRTAPGPPAVIFPLSWRVGNALVSCVTYLRQMVFPTGLAVLYPFPGGGQPLWKVATSALFLAALSVWFFVRRKKEPYLLAGWLWYLGTLAPVLGVLQMGRESHADRYTYLPQIGIYILLTWALAERLPRKVLGAAAIPVIAALSVCAWVQTSYWKDSETLWRRDIAATPGQPSVLSRLDLGLALGNKGRYDEAIAEFNKALALDSDVFATRVMRRDCYGDLGLAYIQKNEPGEAVRNYRKALEIGPEAAQCRYNLGYALLRDGKADDAIPELRRALELKPEYPEALLNLGGALRAKGRVDDAILQYRKALEAWPDYPEANYDLGNALLQKGEVKEAVQCFKKTLQASPEFAPALNNLAWVMATSSDGSLRDAPLAIQLAAEASRLSGRDADTLRTLAAAYASAGRFAEAVQTCAEAAKAASSQGDAARAAVIGKELEYYKAGSQWHAPP